MFLRGVGDIVKGRVESFKTLLKQKCNDARQIVVELAAVKSLLSEAVQNWTNFKKLYKSLLSWLIEAEQKKNEANSDFFNVTKIKETKDQIDSLNDSSNFLVSGLKDSFFLFHKI